jgi:hypothetical protein
MKLIFLSNQIITEKAIKIISLRNILIYFVLLAKKLFSYLIFAQQKIYFENMIKKCQPFACNVFQLWQEHSLIHTEWLLINRLTGMIIALIKIKERLIMKKIFSIIFFKPFTSHVTAHSSNDWSWPWPIIDWGKYLYYSTLYIIQLLFFFLFFYQYA